MNASPTDALRAGAVDVAQRLQRAGFIAYWAGGCVRDDLMGRAPKDYDVATNATPDGVLALFPRAVSVGKAFGVVRVRVGEHEYEVATFRQDQAYRDGRHPSAVTFSDPPTDAQRRDFTINALFFDPVTGVLHDFVGGREDLRRRVIRAVGDPRQRLAEDHLRLLRAIRFAFTFEFTLDEGLLAAIREQAESLRKISVERIQQELTRLLLESKRAGDAVDCLQQVGLLKVVLPEVDAMKGQAQPPQFHPEGDVFTHTMLMLNAMQQPCLRLSYAVLLHDVGKPGTATLDQDRIRFNKHAQHGAALVGALLERLRLPKADIEAIRYCVGNHMRFMDVRKMRRATLRQLLGAPTFPIELELHRLDCVASHGDLSNYDFLVAFQRQCAAEPVLPDPWISGHDLLALGVPGGPAIGKWKQIAYEAQLDGRYEEREALLQWLKRRLAAGAAEAP